MHQIRLDNAAFEGENNAYLLVGGDGPTTLVDTGVDRPEVEAGLRRQLADYDVGFEQIEQVFLTHFHQDHSGLAASIQQESDATVYVHAAEIDLLGNSRHAKEEVQTSYGEGLDAWGVPQEKQDELESMLMQARRLAGDPVDATALDLEATYPAGPTELTPVHLPGHTVGHVGYQMANDELIGGDAILPVYTPNIGGADPRVRRPLPTYLETLATIVRMHPPCVWPGHRDRIDDPPGRAREIRDHHRDRTRRILETLDAEGPITVWDLAIELFGSLSTIHILHGPGEAYAHLDHLEEAGIVEERGGLYRVLEDQVDYDALVPAVD